MDNYYKNLRKEMIEYFESTEISSFEDMINAIKEINYLDLKLDEYFIDNDFYITENYENFCDWKNYEYEASVYLQHKKIIPPYHSIEIDVYAKNEIKKVLFKYQYQFGHIIKFIVETDVLIKKIFRLIRTVYYINKCRNETSSIFKKKFAKIRYFSTLKHWDDCFIISESMNQLYTKNIESWLDEMISPEQSIEKAKAYEDYWSGVPENRRFKVITNI